MEVKKGGLLNTDLCFCMNTDLHLCFVMQRGGSWVNMTRRDVESSRLTTHGAERRVNADWLVELRFV